MSRLIGEHYEAGGVRVRWYEQGDEITVERHQDAQDVVDLVSAVNAEGAPTIDGLGKPIAEVPVVAAMAWAAERGIPWEKLLYSNEYDTEFKRFCAEHSKLRYQNTKSVHGLS
jgi:hypothetical protein